LSNTEYWNNRARKFGHTGWSNHLIYAFDQSARLKAIEHIIAKIQIARNTALDFGTGSGDFARNLSESFKKVIAFDTAEKVLNIGGSEFGNASNIDYCCEKSVMDLDIADGELDVILSVTVLGHLMDDGNLRAHLKYFYEKLSDDGKIIALEYTPSKELAPAEYQRFLTFNQWKMAFHSINFVLNDCYGFYSPTESPCKSYEMYKDSITVKLMGKAQQFGWAKKQLKKMARNFVNDNNDYYWPCEENDRMKIMIFRKQV